MIERYTLPEMGRIWESKNRFQCWLDVEIAAVEALAELGRVPKEAVETIKQKANFDVKRIEEFEAVVHHDVIAFLQSVTEFVGEPAKYIHMGMTSSDVLDTALSLQMKQAGEIILKDLKRFDAALAEKAKEYKDTPMIGRTHGVHAEPVTFGLKLILWLAENRRNIARMERAIETVSVGKISGAVGTYANIDPYVEEYVCKKLGLTPSPISTQVLQRDRHAEYLSTLAIIGASLEKIAVELRSLQRTEILEAEEMFHEGQKGSSAMPHKRNPITGERIAGLARLLRSNALAALENVALWHERDISHSSVERVIIPDSTILTDYMLNKMITMIEKLLVYPENMKRNLNHTNGLIFSQRVLLALVDKGVSREESYKWVQRNAMATWRGEGNFLDLLLADRDVCSYLNEQELREVFNYDYHLKHVDTIFARFGLL